MKKNITEELVWLYTGGIKANHFQDPACLLLHKFLSFKYLSMKRCSQKLTVSTVLSWIIICLVLKYQQLLTPSCKGSQHWLVPGSDWFLEVDLGLVKNKFSFKLSP
jgi:hypothetical protein